MIKPNSVIVWELFNQLSAPAKREVMQSVCEGLGCSQRNVYERSYGNTKTTDAEVLFVYQLIVKKCEYLRHSQIESLKEYYYGGYKSISLSD